MKIAIVCGHFIPQLGYVEVHLAKAFAQLGHRVRVITSNKTSFSAKHLMVVDHQDDGLPYEVVRLSAWLSYGQLVRAKGINKALDQFNPHKVIVIGLGKIFPKEVFTKKHKNFELITLLGDNEDTYSPSTKKGMAGVKRAMIQARLKTPVYELAIKNSDRLIGYTPSTLGVVESFVSPMLMKDLRKKYSTTSLGFHEAEFFLNQEQRKAARERLGLTENEPVLITATRVNASKKLEVIIDALQQLKAKGLSFKYILIGFSADEYSRKLKKYIIEKNLKEDVITLSFMPRVEMNTYYNLADIGVWTQTAISIFEAMATGLFLVLPDKKNLSHVLAASNGEYYNPEALSMIIQKSINNLDQLKEKRSSFANHAKVHFSFQKIAHEIIQD